MPNQPREPSENELLDDVDEAEDDRVAAEEANEVADADQAAAADARAGRVPAA